MNKIIDLNFYPVEEGRLSNLRHRPIGLGVQVGVAADPNHALTHTLRRFPAPYRYPVSWAMPNLGAQSFQPTPAFVPLFATPIPGPITSWLVYRAGHTTLSRR